MPIDFPGCCFLTYWFFLLPVQITHSLPPWAIPAVLAANSLSLLLYNVAGNFVTDELGALSRTVFESARTLFVWLVRVVPHAHEDHGCPKKTKREKKLVVLV